MFKTLKKLDYRIKKSFKTLCQIRAHRTSRPTFHGPITKTKKKNKFQMTKKHVNKINSGMGVIEGPISP